MCTLCPPAIQVQVDNINIMMMICLTDLMKTVRVRGELSQTDSGGMLSEEHHQPEIDHDLMDD